MRLDEFPLHGLTTLVLISGWLPIIREVITALVGSDELQFKISLSEQVGSRSGNFGFSSGRVQFKSRPKTPKSLKFSVVFPSSSRQMRG